MKFNLIPGACMIWMLLLLQPAMGQDSVSAIPKPTIASDTQPTPPRPRPVKKDTTVRKPAVTVRDSLLPTIIDSATLYTAICKREKPQPPVDSLFHVTPAGSAYGPYTGGWLRKSGQFQNNSPVPQAPSERRNVPRRDWVFYLFCAILLFLAFTSLSFGKYFQDLFRVFFNTSLRQKQIREQLTQAPLPSLLLNIIFFIVGGVFLFFLFQHFGLDTGYSAGLEISGWILGLALVYAGKFIFVSLLGWIFEKREAAEDYLFTVFMVNKVTGLFLLPMTIMLAYADKPARPAILTLTGIGLSLLLIMRMARSYMSLNNTLKINILHFVVFVIAFELIPVMLIYRVLFHYII